MDDLSDVSTQTADRAQSVSASAQEQTAATTDVTETIHGVVADADELSEALDEFTLRR